jgi:tRNA A37 threonylcarbamoyladenosine biosynthesis protein TsaE
MNVYQNERDNLYELFLEGFFSKLCLSDIEWYKKLKNFMRIIEKLRLKMYNRKQINYKISRF